MKSKLFVAFCLIASSFVYAQDEEAFVILGVGDFKIGVQAFYKLNNQFTLAGTSVKDLTFNPGSAAVVPLENNRQAIYLTNPAVVNAPVKQILLEATLNGIVSYSRPKNITSIRPSNPYVMEYFAGEEDDYVAYVRGNRLISRLVDPFDGGPDGPPATMFTSNTGQIVTASVDPDGFMAVIVTYSETHGYLMHLQRIDEGEPVGNPVTFRLSGAVIHVEAETTPDGYLVVSFQEARTQNGQYQVAAFNFSIDLTGFDGSPVRRLSPWTTIDPADAGKYRLGALAQIDRNGNSVLDSVVYSIVQAGCDEPVQFLRNINVKTAAPTSKAKKLTDCETAEFNRSFVQIRYDFR